MLRQPVIYIVSNQKSGTLYTGVTSDLVKRIAEHNSGTYDGFTKNYGCKLLVHFEPFETMETAILREKRIKSWSRKKKLALIEKDNPNWKDLYETIL
jgi:predicted GIY-YIG superfamily endonuclease